MTLKTQPPPLRLGLSMVGSGSPAARRALVRHAAQIGFDVVHLIETPRPGVAGAARSGVLADLVLNGSYELLKLGQMDRVMVAIGPLRNTAGEMAEQVAVVRRKAETPVEPVEIAFNFLQVSIDDPTDLSVVRQLLPDAPEGELRRLATVLDGSIASAVDRVRHFYEELGISFLTFHMSDATAWNTLEAIASAVKPHR
jgi:hypothetical protein